jgi:hypothetical protein
MSTQQTIIELEAAGTLVRYMPRINRPPRRRLFLCPDAQKDLVDPRSATNVLVGKAHILNALDRWVLGEKIYGKKRGEFLDRLKPPPPDIWEIRATEPSVQARLFGRFAKPDTLVLTKFHTRSMLGKRGSQGWKQAMAGCHQVWEALFPNHPYFTHSDVQSYVTENCDAFPI